MRASLHLIMAAFAALAASAGCHAARLAVPLDLASAAPESPCRGRQGFAFNEDFSCGALRVQGVHRSWTHSTGMSTWGFVSARARQRYEFAVAGGSGPIWDGQFAVVADMARAEFVDFVGGTFELELRSDAALVGIVTNRDTGQTWKLAVGRMSGADLMQGTLRGGAWSIDVEGSRRLAGTSIPISDESGYILSHQGRALAAVEVINQGAVWLHPSVDAEVRGALAAASAALLLYQDLDTRR